MAGQYASKNAIENLWAEIGAKTSSHLRVVQTQTILFLKPLSERVGSDIEQHRILNDLKTLLDDAIQIQSRSMSDPPLSDIDFKNKMGMYYP